MKFFRVFVAFSTVAALGALAAAQTGTLDQVSPWPTTGNSAWFNGGPPSLDWQAQVRAGIAGQLEGFKLLLDGNAGSQLDVSVRIGDGWNTSPVVFQQQLTKQANGYEYVFVNTTASNLTFNVGDTFVIEMVGNNTNCGMIGSYVDPLVGPPLYPEFLFLGGPGCFAGCGWRIGFETYVTAVQSTPTAYCTAGTTMHGCTATISGSANPHVGNTAPCQITVSGVEGQKNGIVFYGLQQLIQPWCAAGGGSSFLCVKTPTMRTGAQNSGGTVNSCNGTLSLNWTAFQGANPGALGSPWTAGQKAYVQGWFRDPGNCKPTSLSNALELTYLP